MQHAVADGQRQRQAQRMAEQQRGRRHLRAQARPHFLEVARGAVQQVAVGGVRQAVGVAGVAQQAIQRGQVGREGTQRAQQAAPGRVALDAQVFQGRVQVAEGFGEAVVIDERLAQLNRFGQGLAGLALLAQQALATEQHVAVEEGLGQRVVGVVGRAGAFVDVLGEEIQLQVAADFRAGATIAYAVQDDFLRRVERRHHPAVLLRQFQAPRFHIQLADRFEQRRLELEVTPQFAKQPRQALLHRLVGKQRLPQHRQHAVPGGTGHQQQRFMPEIGDRATALVHADHGVHRQNQRRRGNRAIAFAQGSEHGQAEGGQGQGDREDPGIREQQLHRQCGDAETHQRDCQGVEATLPAVIGLGQGAGDNPQEQWDQQRHFILVPAQRHAAGEGDEYPNAVAEFIQRPQAPHGLLERGR